MESLSSQSQSQNLTNKVCRLKAPRTLLALLAGLAVTAAFGLALADTPPPPLSTVPVPVPDNLGDFVKNKAAAIRLGKALFWDQQVGSDGQACGTCHFHAGADSRVKNQLDPGLLATPPDTIFGNNPLTGQRQYRAFGPNYTVKPGDFPFHKLKDPGNRSSTVLADTNDILSSQGVFLYQFTRVQPHVSQDKGKEIPDPVFNVKGVNTRRVEPRNTPTVINAVFNFHNFWDGRADPNFNGINPFGPADLNAAVLINTGGKLATQHILIPVSSLASQAVGPPVSNFEMSYQGRTFAQIGKKMLSLRPLGLQVVHPNDSVLGPLSRVKFVKGATVVSRGLNIEYATMIQAAFRDQYWNSNMIVRYKIRNEYWHGPTQQDPRSYYLANGEPTILNPHPGVLADDEFTQMEANFSLFFGLAVQMYVSTLVSDDTPFDRFQAGNLKAMTAQQQRGMNVFFNKGGCSSCHAGPEFTEGSVSHIQGSTKPNTPPGDFLDQLTTLAGPDATYDAGFVPTSVRRIVDDVGRATEAPFINPSTGQPFPLAHVELMDLKKLNLLPPSYAAVVQDLPAGIEVGHLKAVSGAFKVPGLRNVELTGPYFHNGGQATLMQVIQFYNRGSDFADTDPEVHDTRVTTLNLSDQEQQDLVAFLLALTDERVRWEMAPFDHPQITVPSGLRDNKNVTTKVEETLDIPATGAGGLGAERLSPLKPFLGLNPFLTGYQCETRRQ